MLTPVNENEENFSDGTRGYSRIVGKKSECFFAGLEPSTFRLLTSDAIRLHTTELWETRGH